MAKRLHVPGWQDIKNLAGKRAAREWPCAGAGNHCVRCKRFHRGPMRPGGFSVKGNPDGREKKDGRRRFPSRVPFGSWETAREIIENLETQSFDKFHI